MLVDNEAHVGSIPRPNMGALNSFGVFIGVILLSGR